MRPRPEDLADIEGANRRFLAEAARYRLSFRCEDCVHLAVGTGGCTLEWPNALLRGEQRAISDDGRLVFCKFFELA